MSREKELQKPVLSLAELNQKPFLTVEEASMLLGRSPNAVRQLLKKGRLPIYKDGGRTYLQGKDVRNLLRPGHLTLVPALSG